MNTPADDPWAGLWFKTEAGEISACPCLQLSVYLDETNRAHVLAFYERALELLRPHLTHYLAESMRAPAKLTPRAWSMVPTWLRKPKEAHEYKITFWAGERMDVSPWSLSLQYDDLSLIHI